MTCSRRPRVQRLSRREVRLIKSLPANARTIKVRVLRSRAFDMRARSGDVRFHSAIRKRSPRRKCSHVQRVVGFGVSDVATVDTVLSSVFAGRDRDHILRGAWRANASVGSGVTRGEAYRDLLVPGIAGRRIAYTKVVFLRVERIAVGYVTPTVRHNARAIAIRIRNQLRKRIDQIEAPVRLKNLG